MSLLHPLLTQSVRALPEIISDAAASSDQWLTRGLTVVGIIAVGVIIRWVLHRLVDRLIRRTEDGVRRDGSVSQG